MLKREPPKAVFDVHPSIFMMQSVVAGMKEKTGRSLEEWLEFVAKDGPSTEKERREWLKARHGLGTNYASWIAEKSVGKGEVSDPAGYLRLA
jgi:hypothetical protein